MLKSTFSEGIIIHELGGVGGEWFCVWLRGASWGSNELWTSFRGDYVISAKDVFVYVCVFCFPWPDVYGTLVGRPLWLSF